MKVCKITEVSQKYRAFLVFTRDQKLLQTESLVQYYKVFDDEIRYKGKIHPGFFVKELKYLTLFIPVLLAIAERKLSGASSE
jgi:hypothetical protein